MVIMYLPLPLQGRPKLSMAQVRGQEAVTGPELYDVGVSEDAFDVGVCGARMVVILSTVMPRARAGHQGGA